MPVAFLFGLILEVEIGAVKPAMTFCQLVDLPFSESQPWVAARAAPRAALLETCTRRTGQFITSAITCKITGLSEAPPVAKIWRGAAFIHWACTRIDIIWAST